MKNKLLVIHFIFILIFSSCQDDVIEINEDLIPNTTLKINRFISDVMNDVYLWNEFLPQIDYTKEEDSEEYFYKLLVEEDRWSFITDDYESLVNSFNGIEKSFGYSLAFGLFSDSENEVFAVVEFVYPNTPASNAGLKRGDIIIEINNKVITTSNYTDLLFGDQISIQTGVVNFENQEIKPSGIVHNLVAETLTLNPILLDTVINYENRKIGYLVYNQFIGSYNSSLDEVFQKFNAAQIDNLVVDLRYNPGGGIDAARHFCSCIAPQNVVTNSSTLVTYQWNNKYQDYWEEINFDFQLRETFNAEIPVNLNLDEIHILTGRGTASASELTITGLQPYMEVTLVGDTTFGKYVGSLTFRPEDLIYESDPDNIYTREYTEDFNNWALQPIVLRYANANGETNFKNGFAPDFYEEDALIPATPLGEITEPLLKRAIEDITGTGIIAMKKAMLPSFKLFDRGFSKFDPFKRNLNMGKLKPDHN